MKTVTVEEFQSHFDQYVGTNNTPDLLITRDGKPVAWVRTVDQDYDDEDRAYINDPAFWKMIDERRKEVGIPWDEAEKLLGLDTEA